VPIADLESNLYWLYSCYWQWPSF